MRPKKYIEFKFSSIRCSKTIVKLRDDANNCEAKRWCQKGWRAIRVRPSNIVLDTMHIALHQFNDGGHRQIRYNKER